MRVKWTATTSVARWQMRLHYQTTICCIKLFGCKKQKDPIDIFKKPFAKRPCRAEQLGKLNRSHHPCLYSLSCFANQMTDIKDLAALLALAAADLYATCPSPSPSDLLLLNKSVPLLLSSHHLRHPSGCRYLAAADLRLNESNKALALSAIDESQYWPYADNS